MKRLGLLLIVVLAISAVVAPALYLSSLGDKTQFKTNSLFFGVTYGQETVKPC